MSKLPGYPLAFMGESIRGIYGDEKTQTRRNCKAIPPAGAVRAFQPDDDCAWWRWEDQNGQLVGDSFQCPYGTGGDLLWVREDFRVSSFYDKMTPAQLPNNDLLRVRYEADQGPMSNFGRKRESMYMPRLLSRLTLRLESVRVERLQVISDADCIAEGVDAQELTIARNYMREKIALQQIEGCSLRGYTPERYAYARMWERANGQGTWQINPLVWVLEFSRIENNIDKHLAEADA